MYVVYVRKFLRALELIGCSRIFFADVDISSCKYTGTYSFFEHIEKLLNDGGGSSFYLFFHWFNKELPWSFNRTCN